MEEIQEIKTPLVTVYITNYNYGKFIKTAIDSVLMQSFQDFEIIIIDDGSTDGSREIIESYRTHDRIEIIFQKNKGLNVTNNIALRTARGKYIMRLDADDFLDQNALLVMTNMLEKDPELGLVFPDYFIVDAKGNILNVEKRHSFENEVSLPDQPAHGACTMIRKQYLESVGGYDEDYRCQDGYELWVKFIAKYKVTNTSSPLFYYRQHGSNLTTNETRILETRALIKEKHVKRKVRENPNVLAIIPARGYTHGGKNLSFQKLADEYILDMKIRESLAAKKVNEVVVSSPDTRIKEYITERYGSNVKVRFHEREESLARLNTDLVGTVESILDRFNRVREIDYILLTSLEYPFISGKNMDDAINTMQIFRTDSVISVRPERDLLFQHDGSGMKAILNQDKFSKLEREALYRYTGGIIVTAVKHFLKNKQLISGRVGHIVVDQKAAHSLRSDFDIELAEYLALKSKSYRSY